MQVRWPQAEAIRRAFVETQAGMLSFTTDRQKFVHPEGQRLVCRKSEDLSIVWTRSVDPAIVLSEKDDVRKKYPISIAHANYSISGDGSIAVLAPQRSAFRGRRALYYLEIIDGNTGEPLNRWQTQVKERVILSPDGRLIAIDGPEVIQQGRFAARVRIFDVKSGKQLAAVTHDDNVKTLGNAMILDGMAFTPDGRHLITSANTSVKIWRISVEATRQQGPQ